MRNPYTPPDAPLEDPVIALSGGSRVANLIALPFAAGAAITVAIGTLVSDLLTDHSEDPFGPMSPISLVLLTMVLSLGTFAWSWLVCVLTAKALDIERGRSLLACGSLGVLFGLLTPALGYIVSDAPIAMMIVALGIWVIAFPVAATYGIARRAQLNR